MTKKIIFILMMVFSFIFGFCVVGSVFAGGVTDTNNGNKGDILIHSGITNGSNDRGTWTDSSSFKGEKGDQGLQGVKGDSGNDGETPIKGNDYFDGKDGQNGINGKNGVVDYSKFKDVINNNDKINDINNRVNDLEKTQTVIEGQIRIIDTKKWKVKPFVSYSFTRNIVDRVGAKITYKMGQSYEEKMIEKLQQQIDQIESLVNMEEQQNLNYADKNYDIRVTKSGTTIITEKNSNN